VRTADIHALTGPYVLDAVADDERTGFEQHLALCADCSTEVGDLREAVTKLSVYVAIPPPAGVKPRVMTVVLSKQQDAAVVLVRDLKPLQGRKTYQLWFVDAAKQARSIGLTDGASLQPAVVTGGVSDQVAFSVTVEPDGGSARPTLPADGVPQPVVNL
jgi:anti-sigma-K factor RskA